MTREEARKAIKEAVGSSGLMLIDEFVKREVNGTLDKLRAELLQLKTKTSFTFVNIDDVLRLIDKHMESKENENIN